MADHRWPIGLKKYDSDSQSNNRLARYDFAGTRLIEVLGEHES